MTAEERAAVEWLEGLPVGERMHHFRPPAGEPELFTLKDDHERSSTGRCYRCQPTRRGAEVLVIE